MIELRHPVHGVKHAYSDLEVAADEKNGWVRVPAECFKAEGIKIVSEVSTVEPVKRKPGRPRKAA